MRYSSFQEYATTAILQSLIRGNKLYTENSGFEVVIDKCTHEEEARVGTSKYADLVCDIVYKHKKSGKEHTEVCVFEMKSCNSDLKSGWGMNFVGDRNFLVVPGSTTARRLGNNVINGEDALHYLDSRGFQSVGVLKVAKDGKIECVRPSWDSGRFGHLFLAWFGDREYKNNWCYD